MESTVWIEAAMLPFLVILGISLASRFATKSDVSESFLALAWSALAATSMDVIVRIVPSLSPGNFFIAEVEHHFAVTVCSYCLLRYVAAYVQQSSNPVVKINFLILCVSVTLLFLHLLGWGTLRGPLYQVLSFGPAALFAIEAFCLQLIYQKYYGNGQFIVMNLIFLLLIDAFVIQYVLRQNFPVIFVVATILLFITFFYLQAPTYRQIVYAGEQTEKERTIAEWSIQQTNRANRAKSDFLANTSHEIRTPMNAILGMNEMILKTSLADPDTRMAANDIQRAGNHLLNIINNILDISKIESGKMELFAEDYHLWHHIKEWEDFTHKQIQEEQREKRERENSAIHTIRGTIQFNIDVDKTLPEFLHGDIVRLQQIMTNLLSNAVKFTREGSITLTVSGEMETKTRIILRISVADTGIGLYEADLKRIFEPFERANLLETRDVLGAGLGMPLVRHLVKLMNGEISIESEYGKGTIVTVSIPQYVAASGNGVTIAEYEEEYELEKLRKEKEAQEAAEAAANSGPFTCPDAKLLIVDDTPVNLVVAKGMMGGTEAHIDTAESGEDALEKMQKTHYDIVFLDHKMPGMDGIETLGHAKALGEITKGTIYVALTANADARAQYIGFGFDEYLPKPFKSDALMAILRKFLKNKQVKEQA